MKVSKWLTTVLSILLITPAVMAQKKRSPFIGNELLSGLDITSDDSLLAQSIVPVEEVYAQAGVPAPQAQNIRRGRTSSGGYPGGGFGGGGFGMMSSEAHSAEPTEVRVFALKYYDAESMAGILSDIFPIGVYPDKRNNQLIVSSDVARLTQIESLIQTMDKPESKQTQTRDQRNLLYRIYMVEPLINESNLRRFTIVLSMAEKPLDISLLQNSLESGTLKVTGFDSDQKGTKLVGVQQVPAYEVSFEGFAESMDDLKMFAEKVQSFSGNVVPEIRALHFEEDGNQENDTSASMHSNLPGNVKGHLEKLLGSDIKTVGYWFGNSSMSGELRAPVGDWSVAINSQNSGDDRLELEVELSGRQAVGMQTGLPAISSADSFGGSAFPRSSSRRGRGVQNVIWGNESTILQNTVQSQIGKPVIIGYNRNIGNGRRMGALVIMPELDTVSSTEN